MNKYDGIKKLDVTIRENNNKKTNKKNYKSYNNLLNRLLISIICICAILSMKSINTVFTNNFIKNVKSAVNYEMIDIDYEELRQEWEE